MASSPSDDEDDELAFFPPTPKDAFSPRKCLGFSVGPPSVLVLVWNPQVSYF